MFSWGSQAGMGNKLFTKFSKHPERMNHPYYSYGFHNPPEGDLYEAAFKINWKEVLASEIRSGKKGNQ